MKRFVIATASALFLLAGTAAASSPTGPATRVAHNNSFSSSAIGGPGVETAVPDGLPPLVPGIDPAVPDPGLALPGLPGTVSELLGTVDPALANLVEAPPAPVAGSLSPVIGAPSAVEPPAPVPGLTGPSEPDRPKASAPAPARKQAKGLTKKADLRTAAAATDIFKGLPAGGHAAYGTGSVIHTHVLQVGNQRLENTDVAFSGATFSSAPISEIKNEMARIVAPALGAGNAFARASGLEVGLAIDQSGQNQIIPGKRRRGEGPAVDRGGRHRTGDVNVAPLLSAKLLRGQAQSQANAACTTGIDLSYGLGFAADVGLVSGAPLGTPVVSTAADPDRRSVSWSHSRTFLVPQEGASSPIRKFGLASETRMTIAPVTLFKGVSGQELTLEFAGEWVLRTVADGKNPVKVLYGPGEVSPSTPFLRILRPGQQAQDILTTQAAVRAQRVLARRLAIDQGHHRRPAPDDRRC